MFVVGYGGLVGLVGGGKVEGYVVVIFYCVLFMVGVEMDCCCVDFVCG